MKVSALLLTAASMASVALASDYVFCKSEQKGAPCTSPDGLPSRCGSSLTCETHKPCPPSAKKLDACEVINRCYPLSPGDTELKCLRENDILTYINYDQCNGKADGDSCSSLVVFSGYQRFSVYEEEGSKCSNHRCPSASYPACHDKNEGDACSYVGVEDKKLYKITGTCHTDYPYLYALSCKTVSKEEVGKATMVMGRDDAKEGLVDTGPAATPAPKTPATTPGSKAPATNSPSDTPQPSRASKSPRPTASLVDDSSADRSEPKSGSHADAINATNTPATMPVVKTATVAPITTAPKPTPAPTPSSDAAVMSLGMAVAAVVATTMAAC